MEANVWNCDRSPAEGEQSDNAPRKEWTIHGCESLAGSYNRGEADEEEGFDGGAEGDERRLGLIFREVEAYYPQAKAPDENVEVSETSQRSSGVCDMV